MQPVKSIFTTFRGTIYRSRTEARWAHAFYRMGIEFVYEPDLFDVGLAARYLPDFFLVKSKIYIEVKPFKQPEPLELAKCEGLVKATSRPVFMLCGKPEMGAHKVLAFPGACEARGFHVDDNLIKLGGRAVSYAKTYDIVYGAFRAANARRYK